MKKVKCNKCGHKWLSKTDDSKITCPKCDSNQSLSIQEKLEIALGLIESQSTKGASQPTKGATTSATTGAIGDVKPKKKKSIHHSP